MFLKKLENLIGLVVIVEVFFLDFLAEFFFDFLVETGVMYLLPYDEGGFGCLGLLELSEFPFFDGFDEFR